MVRYYSELADKFAWWHRILRTVMLVTMLVAASGATATLLAQVEAWISAVVLLVVAGVTAWQWTSDYQTKSVAADLMCQQYRDLVNEFRVAWYKDTTSDDIMKLLRRYDTIGAGYTLDTDHSINQRATEDAYESIRNQFAV